MVAAAVVGATAVAGIAGSAMQASAAGDAANAQLQSSNNANAAQMAMFNQTQQNLSPFIDSGTATVGKLRGLMGVNAGQNPLASYFGPITPNKATIAQTPGYQFNLYQGLKATQNSAAARGLGVSGAALKGAANYATGLADSTYQNQFNNLVTNQNNVFNRLFNGATLGENAAAGLGTNATATGQGIASNTIGGGNAIAAGDIGSANAIANGVSGAAGNVQSAYLLNQLMKQNGGSGLFAGSGGGSYD